MYRVHIGDTIADGAHNRFSSVVPARATLRRVNVHWLGSTCAPTCVIHVVTIFGVPLLLVFVANPIFIDLSNRHFPPDSCCNRGILVRLTDQDIELPEKGNEVSINGIARIRSSSYLSICSGVRRPGCPRARSPVATKFLWKSGMTAMVLGKLVPEFDGANTSKMTTV